MNGTNRERGAAGSPAESYVRSRFRSTPVGECLTTWIGRDVGYSSFEKTRNRLSRGSPPWRVPDGLNLWFRHYRPRCGSQPPLSFGDAGRRILPTRVVPGESPEEDQGGGATGAFAAS
jgi:hypothetical protein